MTIEEQWIPVIGFETHYSVSNFGRVMRTSKVQGAKIGIVNPWLDRDGYARIYFQVKGKRFRTAVHRLVAMAFLPNPLNLPQVNHKDGVKDNNSISNLEWVTSQENHIHCRRILGLVVGEKHGCSKLKTDQIESVREMLSKNVSVTRIAKFFGVHHSTISRVKNKISWNCVT